MKLVQILSLVDKVTHPIRADLRTRRADGQLTWCIPSEEHKAVMGVLTQVTIKLAGRYCGVCKPGCPKVPWLYWYFTPDPSNSNTLFSCGYSGIRMDSNPGSEHLLIED